MVEEVGFEETIAFKCTVCGYLFQEIERAEECEKWCARHNSCNFDITKYALKMRRPNG